MALERSEVEKIAHLARLGLSDSELPQTTATLNSILGLIDNMQAVDTTGIEPLAHPLETHQRLRASRSGRACNAGAGRAAHGHAVRATHQAHEERRDRHRGLHGRARAGLR